MAPIKFEDNIREKLQERELTPSPEAWAKLSEKLEAQTPQKSKPAFIWFAVAASFVGLLLVSTLFFSKDDTSTPIVKESPLENVENILEKQNQSGIATEEILNEPKLESEEIIPSNSEIVTISNNQKWESGNSEKPKESMVNNQVIKESVAINEVKTTTNYRKTETEEEQFITKKVEEVVVAVQQIQNEKNKVTPGEIDVLLAKAQRDIANNRILTSNTKKIDAAALLMDVETELERSFRDRVFNMLGEGFNKVRSAVAERNN